MSNTDNNEKDKYLNSGVEQTSETPTTGEEKLIVVETVEETANTTEEIVLTEVKKFIASFSVLGENGREGIPENTKKYITQAEEITKMMTTSSKEIDELYTLVEHYSQGMGVLLKEAKDGKKENNITKFFTDGLNRAKRIKHIGKILGSVVDEVGKFDRDTMEQLEQRGLSNLSEKAETAIANIKKQYNSLIEAYNSIHTTYKDLENDIKMTDNYLSSITDSILASKLTTLKSNFSQDLILLSSKISLMEHVINTYQTATALSINDLPRKLQGLATNLIVYKTAELGKNSVEFQKNMTELIEASTLAGFEITAKAGNELQEALAAPSISDETLNRMIELTKQNNANATKIALELKTPSKRTQSGLLEALSNANKEGPKDGNLLDFKK